MLSFRINEDFERVKRKKSFGRENVEQEKSLSLSYVSEADKAATTLKDCSRKSLSEESQILLK